jgi:hypothetical protein
LPSLSAEFGIKPHDIDQMTPREVEEYLTQLADLRRQQREAARGAR